MDSAPKLHCYPHSVHVIWVVNEEHEFGTEVDLISVGTPCLYTYRVAHSNHTESSSGRHCRGSWCGTDDLQHHRGSISTGPFSCEEIKMGSVGQESDNMAVVPTTIDHVRLAAMQLVTQSAVSGALAALARLNIFEALANAGNDAQLTASELAERALPGKSVNLTYLGRLLRMVAGMKILCEVVTRGDDGAVERRYALEPIARFLVDDEENGSIVHLLLTYQYPGAFLQTWEHVHESVLDDKIQPFARAHGVNAWEYGKQNPQFDKVFNKAMAGHSKLYMRAILDVYHGFEDVKVLVDVGGGFATSLGLIKARYPHIKGINFDQPHVIDACPELPGVEFVSGNMFDSVPSGGDAIFMKYMLHDWDDESCLKILKNCYQALPADGKVIAVDNILPEVIDFEGGDPIALQVDVHMLAFNDSGARERTVREFLELGSAAGFKQVKVMCKVDALAVVEFHKA